MVRFLPFFIMFCVKSAFAQSPGGVASPAAWYRADASVFSDAGNTSAANNASVYQWNDYLGTGRNLVQATAARRPVYSNSTTLANFNPTVSFTRTSIQWMQCDPGAGNEIIDRASGTFYSAGYMDSDFLGTGFGSGLIGFNDDMDYPGLHTSNNTQFNLLMYAENGVNYTPVSTNAFIYKNSFIAGSSWQNGASTTSPATYGAGTISLNGVHTFYSGNNFRNVNTINTARDFRIGGDTDFGSHNGQLNEVLIYQNILTTQEKNRLESYLAIKYGTTLSANYLNSTNGIVWNSDVLYQNNIFGIARDNNGTLHQKQSRSENNNQKLIIGNGSSLFNTNAANTNSLSDGQFLIVGDNGLKQALNTPLVYTVGSNGETNYRFESIWKVQNTGSVGSVTVAWLKGVANLYLVQSANSAIDNSDTFTPMNTEVTVNGVVYNTATVNLANGQFFTFAGYEFAPGGVAAAAWYRADGSGNLFSDAGTTAAADNTAIQQWNEFNNKPFPLSQSNATYRPQFSSTAKLVNFNSTVNYDGTQKWLQYAPADAQGHIINRSKGALFSAGSTTTASSSLFGFGAAGAGNLMDDPGLYSYTGNKFLFYPIFGEFDPQSMYAINGNYIGGGTWENGTGVGANNGVNITLDGYHQTYNTNITNVNIVADRNALMVGKADVGAQLDGQQNEMIVFANKLTDEEVNKVESYLAIKYSKTLSKEQNRNYLSSTGAVVWEGTVNNSYYNNVFGIARDNISALYQKQSRSENNNQKLIIGVGNSLANTNTANANNLTNGQFLIVGDNGLEQSFTTTLLNASAPGGKTNTRLASIWKVQNTSAVGQVIVAWPKGVSNLHLVQSSDEIFDNTDTFTAMAAEVTINGVVYNTSTVNLANGQFFTLSGYQYAPGGVTSAAWYRADGSANLFSDAGTTAAADNTAIQQWNEFNNKPFPLSQSNATYRPQFSSTTKLVNFNSTVNYDGTQKWLQYAPVDAQGHIINRSKGALFSAGNTTGTGAMFGFGASGAGNAMDDPGLYSYTGNKFLFYPVFGEYDPQSNYAVNGNYIGGGTWENGAGVGGNNSTSITLDGYHQTYNTNVSNVNIVADRNTLMVGKADAGAQLDGQQNEMIVFPNRLTDQEVNRVESYLAIKYGQTLNKEQNRNYLSATSTVVWDGSDINYYNNVLGIAREDISALHQKQSKSINSGQQLIIGNGSSLFDTNVANTNTLTDVSFLMVGDNGLRQGLNMPLAYTAGSNGVTNFRFEAIWKAQNTNNVGSVTVAWPKGISNLYFVQSIDATFDVSDSFTPMTTEVTINGVVYNTATATIANGSFFTFAGVWYCTRWRGYFVKLLV